MLVLGNSSSKKVIPSNIHGLAQQSIFHQQLWDLPEDRTMYTITIVNFRDKKSQPYILNRSAIREMLSQHTHGKNTHGKNIDFNNQLNGIIVSGNGREIIYRGAVFTDSTDPRRAFPARVEGILSH